MNIFVHSLKSASDSSELIVLEEETLVLSGTLYAARSVLFLNF